MADIHLNQLCKIIQDLDTAKAAHAVSRLAGAVAMRCCLLLAGVFIVAMLALLLPWGWARFAVNLLAGLAFPWLAFSPARKAHRISVEAAARAELSAKALELSASEPKDVAQAAHPNPA